MSVSAAACGSERVVEKRQRQVNISWAVKRVVKESCLVCPLLSGGEGLLGLPRTDPQRIT